MFGRVLLHAILVSKYKFIASLFCFMLFCSEGGWGLGGGVGEDKGPRWFSAHVLVHLNDVEGHCTVVTT